MGIPRVLIERLVYGTHSVHRYTQDSPVLADVWIAFGENHRQRQDLILTPRVGSNAAKVATRIRTQLGDDQPESSERPQVAYNQVYVVAKLSFRDLIRVVIPMTRWWTELWRDVARATTASEGEPRADPSVPTYIDATLLGLRARIIREMEDLRDLHVRAHSDDRLAISGVPSEGEPDLPCDLAWLIRLVGVIESDDQEIENTTGDVMGALQLSWPLIVAPLLLLLCLALCCLVPCQIPRTSCP